MKNHEDVLAIVEELKKLYPKGSVRSSTPSPTSCSFPCVWPPNVPMSGSTWSLPPSLPAFPPWSLWPRPTPAEVETYIHSTGFFRAKTRDIVAASRMLVEQYGGRVPDTMEELLKLPGVGRKTANLILGDVYHTPGVVVADTHCIRITGRLGLTDGTKDPAKVEEQLRPILPPEESNDFCHRMVLHGRAVCMARKPDCPNCTLRPWCDFYTKS